MIRGEDTDLALRVGTKRAGNGNREALVALVRSLAIQQARQDHEEQHAEASRDLRQIFLGSAE
jgi:hypothetical protein